MIPKNEKIKSQMPLRDARLRAVDGIVDSVGLEVLGHEPTVTSINEKAPGRREDSYHYDWLAEDLRVNDVEEPKRKRFAERLRNQLRSATFCPYWDVVYKRDRHPSDAIDTSHVHVELDVRRAKAGGYSFKTSFVAPQVGLAEDSSNKGMEEVMAKEVRLVARQGDAEIDFEEELEAATDRLIVTVIDWIPAIPIVGKWIKKLLREKLDEYLPGGLVDDIKQEAGKRLRGIG